MGEKVITPLNEIHREIRFSPMLFHADDIGYELHAWEHYNCVEVIVEDIFDTYPFDRIFHIECIKKVYGEF
jgi:hypothetical protein